MFLPWFVTSPRVLKSKLTVYVKFLLEFNTFTDSLLSTVSMETTRSQPHPPPAVAMIQPNTTERELGQKSPNSNSEMTTFNSYNTRRRRSSVTHRGIITHGKYANMTTVQCSPTQKLCHLIYSYCNLPVWSLTLDMRVLWLAWSETLKCQVKCCHNNKILVCFPFSVHKTAYLRAYFLSHYWFGTVLQTNIGWWKQSIWVDTLCLDTANKFTRFRVNKPINTGMLSLICDMETQRWIKSFQKGKALCFWMCRWATPPIC